MLVGAKRFCISAALIIRTRTKPSKTAFYCITNWKKSLLRCEFFKNQGQEGANMRIGRISPDREMRTADYMVLNHG